jgi:ketosteroid isomerase-like protein
MASPRKIEHRGVASVASARSVVVELHAAIDRGAALSALHLFTDDAYFEARGKTLRGTEEVAKFLSDRQAQTERQTFHLIANETVVDNGADEIELRAFLLVHVRRSEGHYRLDRVLDARHILRRTTDSWLIARRTIRPLHPSPALG